jgi:hypothetical protein
MIYLVIGGVLVTALVGWALTRSVQPATPASVMTDAGSTQPAPVSPPTANVPLTTGGTPFNTATIPPNTSTAPWTPPPQQSLQSPDRAGVGRISAEDLKAKVASGNVTIVDVRDMNSYKSGHIPGALNIPMASIEGEVGYLPKGKDIVTYCT